MTEWWTQPKPSTPGQPERGLAFQSSVGRASSSRAQFIHDDPDPSAPDATAPKFLPSFAASPAGKIALGTSPGGTASPPAAKRSPTARFSVSLADSTSSPRHGRARPALTADDDFIPTASLHDEPLRPASAPAQPVPVPAPSSALVPPALEPSADTTSLHVFGPPPEYLAALRPYLESIGPVVSYEPGPEGSNWWTVTYANPLAATYALRRHGEIVSGRWMLGFKVAGPGSTQGLTLVNGVSPSQPVVHGGGAGTPIQVKHANIIRPKPKPPAQTDAYAWEDADPPSGLLGRAAEFIFGR